MPCPGSFCNTITTKNEPEVHMDKKSELLYDKDSWRPTYYKSRKWYMWKSTLSDRTCDICKKKHGKVLPRNVSQKERPPVHLHCKCRLVMLLTVLIGTIDTNYGKWCRGLLCTTRRVAYSLFDKEAGRGSWLDTKRRRFGSSSTWRCDWRRYLPK